jgi:hypothetical protein
MNGVELCKSDTCRNLAQRRGWCWKHYNRTRAMTDESRSTNHGMATPLGPCLCAEPKPAVIKWFQGGYADREPQPGDAVECRHCGRPIAAFLGRGPQP